MENREKSGNWQILFSRASKSLWMMKFRAIKLKGTCSLEENLWQSFCSYCSVPQLHTTLCDPMNCSMPGFPVLHYPPDFVQTHVHWISNAIQPSHPLLLMSLLPSFFPNIRVFSQWIGSFLEVAKTLELQLQSQSLKWIFRVDFL